MQKPIKYTAHQIPAYENSSQKMKQYNPWALDRTHMGSKWVPCGNLGHLWSPWGHVGRKARNNTLKLAPAKMITKILCQKTLQLANSVERRMGLRIKERIKTDHIITSLLPMYPLTDCFSLPAFSQKLNKHLNSKTFLWFIYNFTLRSHRPSMPNNRLSTQNNRLSMQNKKSKKEQGSNAGCIECSTSAFSVLGSNPGSPVKPLIVDEPNTQKGYLST